MDARSHWDDIYRTRQPAELSWHQPDAGLSLALIRELVPDRGAAIIDVGGGASPLVDALLDDGYRDVTVLDLAPSALSQSRARIGTEMAARITWIADDVCTASLPSARFDVWHDRAVFHFLVEQERRDAYVAQLKRVVRPGGLLLVATFAEDGPTRCSGLPVVRYSSGALHSALGGDLTLVRALREEHHTPSGATQAFTYGVFRTPA